MITAKEARRMHRNTQTYHTVIRGYDENTGKVTHEQTVRMSRVPFKVWMRRAWTLDLKSLDETLSPKLHRIVLGGS